MAHFVTGHIERGSERRECPVAVAIEEQTVGVEGVVHLCAILIDHIHKGCDAAACAIEAVAAVHGAEVLVALLAVVVRANLGTVRPIVIAT